MAVSAGRGSVGGSTWRTGLVALSLMLGAVGCSSDEGVAHRSAPTTSERGSPGADEVAIVRPWSHQDLAGHPGADRPTRVGVDGDDVVVALVGDDGRIAGYASADGAAFEPGDPLDTGVEHLGLGGIVRLGPRWVALGSGGLADVRGDDRLTFGVHAFTSTDGRTWEEPDAIGLGLPGEVNDLVAIDGAVVAVGTLRVPLQPGSAGVEPAVWRTTDGTRWTAVPLPGAPLRSAAATAVVAVGGRLLVSGIDGDGAALWSSDDGGVTWEHLGSSGLTDALPGVGDLAAQGDVLVASGVEEATDEEGRPALLRSSDGGRTWSPVDGPPPSEHSDSVSLPLVAGGGRFLTLAGSFLDAYQDPELCYADLTRCQGGSAMALYESDDGNTWRRIDTSGLGAGEDADPDLVAATDDGRTLAFQQTGSGLRASTAPAGAALPGAEEPTAEDTDVTFLGAGEDPEVGVAYAVPLYVHCGMTWLYVGDQPWKRTDHGADVETGAGQGVPAGWPAAQQAVFGFATLVAPDRLEYSIGDGEVIATYRRSERPAPGCA